VEHTHTPEHRDVVDEMYWLERVKDWVVLTVLASAEALGRCIHLLVCHGAKHPNLFNFLFNYFLYET